MPRTPRHLCPPDDPDRASRRGKFPETAIGTIHVDISELRLAEGKLTMVLAIDRVSKSTCAELRDDAGKMNGADFLRGVVAAFPCAIHAVLTDNGMAFADLPKNRNGPTRRYLGAHIFDRVCAENGIVHKLTKPYHPWTNGQAERTGRTVKDATVKTFHHLNLEASRHTSPPSCQPVASPSTARRSGGRHSSKPCATPGTPNQTSPRLNSCHLTPGPNSVHGVRCREPQGAPPR